MNYDKLAIPPGETLKEAMDVRGICKEELAKNMNISETYLDKILSGESKLTDEIAVKLEAVIGIPAYFWRNLETNYRNCIENEQESVVINGKQYRVPKS